MHKPHPQCYTPNLTTPTCLCLLVSGESQEGEEHPLVYHPQGLLDLRGRVPWPLVGTKMGGANK